MNAMNNIYDTSEELFVKICGITSEADALLCISLGADAVGFIFAPSPRQVSVQTAGDIAKRLPPEIITVGVFRDEAPQRVVDMVHQASLGAAQRQKDLGVFDHSVKPASTLRISVHSRSRCEPVQVRNPVRSGKRFRDFTPWHERCTSLSRPCPRSTLS